MSMLKIHRTVKAAVLIGCIGITSSPALAISLDEALRASLENSSAIAAARQSWLATREAIGTNTSTTDLDSAVKRHRFSWSNRQQGWSRLHQIAISINRRDLVKKPL